MTTYDFAAGIALGVLLVAGMAYAVARWGGPGKDWTRPYLVDLARRRYDRHVRWVQESDVPERADYIRRRDAGNAIRKQLLALWLSPMKSRSSKPKAGIARLLAERNRREKAVLRRRDKENAK